MDKSVPDAPIAGRWAIGGVTDVKRVKGVRVKIIFATEEEAMPFLKRRLTRSEQLDHLARAKQMRAAGVDVQIRDEWWEAARPLNVTITPFHSHVYDLQRGGAAYAVWYVWWRGGKLPSPIANCRPKSTAALSL